MKKITLVLFVLIAFAFNVKAQQFQMKTSSAIMSTTFASEQTAKACDTLKHCEWTDQLTYVPLASPAWGYLTGNNSYNISKFADKFNVASANTVTTVLFGIGTATAGAPTNSITFKIYPSAAGIPGATALGSANPIPINTMTANSIGIADFPTPVAVNGDFFVEYEVNPNVAGAQDTFYVYLKDGGADASLNTAYVFYNAWVQSSTLISGAPNLAFAFQVVKCTATGIEAQDFSNGIKLSQNAPNPATGSTMIAYEIQNNSTVSLEVYDATGKKIIDQLEGDKSAGKHYIVIDSEKLAKGVYYYTLTANKEKFTKKMIVE